MEQTNVVIGIQARSTSERFPRKIFADLEGKPVLQHVIDACRRTASYLNKKPRWNGIKVTVALLVPDGDEAARHFAGQVTVVEGSENDVLKRYVDAASLLSADYMVRVTGDCPLIPSFLISRHIEIGAEHLYDYLSNVTYGATTSIDGHDCEFISRRLLEYAHVTAKEPADREHVTTLIRRSPPEWAKVGAIVGYVDYSATKLSVDTEEDLERVRKAYRNVKTALSNADAKFGTARVHRV